MKSVIKHSLVYKLITLSFALFFLINIGVSAQNGDANKGKELFNANCAACHKLDKKLIGPALGNIADRRSNAWLKSWIKDNNALRASGDADAKAIFEQYNGMPMTPFPQLSEKDIDDVIAYTSVKTQDIASTQAVAVDPRVAEGKQLFQANCAACHKLDKKLIGPALANMADRRTKEWLHAWIKDNNALRATGDADAKAIFEQFNGMPMTPFPQLTTDDIDKIIAYTSYAEPKTAVAPLNAEASNLAKPTPSNTWMSVVVGMALLALIAWIFVRSNNGFLKIVATIFLLFGVAYAGFAALFEVGIDTDYQPLQPIQFSHKIHAGDNKIDCQYCHSSAKHSKTSGIPSLNVCMNCHKNISEYTGTLASGKDKAFYDGEIQKIYNAIGWDKTEMVYKPDFQPIPVKWVLVHNLADFAYFNHSQHVTVAGVTCQTCHGPVQEMEEVKQFTKLTMGWCITCHKTTDVKMTGNGYYKNIQEQLSKKYGIQKVTEAQMGGQECGKCHY